jgi:redox-sensitive bicupin YhaK (pirin superfamily)
MNAIVEQVIRGRARDLGDFQVRRSLPHASRRLVGPFIFLDEMGPATFEPGAGIDVRPHPHIALATVTYLFKGKLLHQDSLGVVQEITPGALNWMTAGRGVTHSERTPEAERAAGHEIHGLQAWVALPTQEEERLPTFEHVEADKLPDFEIDGVRLKLIAGRAYGREAPVEVLSPLFYVLAEFKAGGALALPDEHAERAAYVVDGPVEAGGEEFEAGDLIVFKEGPATVSAPAGGRVMLLGGAKLEGERHIFWNFVSSSKDRLEQAKQDWVRSAESGWTDTPFVLPPHDNDEHIPLPSG